MNFLDKLRDIDTFVLDVDGVLTNGSLLVMQNGHLLRQMNTRDGYAIRRAVKEGYRVVIITGGNSEGVISRLRELGITDLFSGVAHKKPVLKNYLREHQINPDTVLYMGDDIPDYHSMRLVGLPACPHDAAHEIVELARYISPFKGGEGCVRDVIEKVMRLHDRWLDSEMAADEARIKSDEL